MGSSGSSSLLVALHLSLVLLVTATRDHASSHSAPFQSRPYVEHFAKGHHSGRPAARPHGDAEPSLDLMDARQSKLAALHRGRFSARGLPAPISHIKWDMGATISTAPCEHNCYLQAHPMSTSPSVGARRPALASTQPSQGHGRTAAPRASRAFTTPARNAQTMAMTLTAGGRTKVCSIPCTHHLSTCVGHAPQHSGKRNTPHCAAMWAVWQSTLECLTDAVM